jgi:hypothetical protein
MYKMSLGNVFSNLIIVIKIIEFKVNEDHAFRIVILLSYITITMRGSYVIQLSKRQQ